MAHIDSAGDWFDIMSRLDRHAEFGLQSPDLATLPDLMDLYRIPGMAIAVAHEAGSQMWTLNVGTTSMDAAVPIDPHTPFQACSISKHVAALGALRLAEDGVLDLDADIHDYLSRWRLPASHGWRVRITVRQLLAHTAGLSYHWFRGYGIGEPAPTTRQSLRGQAPSNTPPVRASLLPGSQFRYSGSHYAVLQQLMSDVTGLPFDGLMRLLVLDPLGLTDSSFDPRFIRRRADRVARGHHNAGTAVAGGWRVIPEMAGAGLWSTPSDLVRLEMEIARAEAGKSEFLSQDLASQMLTPQSSGGYGLGTAITDESVDSTPRRRFGHDGGGVGYVCFSYAWPDAGAAMAVMANSEDAGEVLQAILAAADRRYARGSDPAPERDVNGLLDVAGRYWLRPDYGVEISVLAGGLILNITGQTPAPLLPLANGGYRVAGLDCELSFDRHDDGDIVMRLRQGDTSYTAPRTLL